MTCEMGQTPVSPRPASTPERPIASSCNHAFIALQDLTPGLCAGFCGPAAGAVGRCRGAPPTARQCCGATTRGCRAAWRRRRHGMRCETILGSIRRRRAGGPGVVSGDELARNDCGKAVRLVQLLPGIPRLPDRAVRATAPDRRLAPHALDPAVLRRAGLERSCRKILHLL